jgi:hypothetical protein
MLFTSNTRRQISTIIETLSTNEAITTEEIEEIGEDLGTQLGKVLEAKIFASRVRNRLGS